MAPFLFTQQWRRNEACFDNLRAAVMAELAAETDKKRRETDRVNSENNTKRTAAAAAAAVAPSEVAGVSEATKTQGDNGNASTAIANNSSSHDCSDDAEDVYGSQVLIPVSLPAAGHSSSSAALAPSRSSSSSSASSGSGGGGGAAGTVPRPPGTEGEPSTALRAVTEKVVGSGDDAEVPAGRDANASAIADTTGKNHSNRRSTATSAAAAAAVAVAGRYAAPSATRRATTTKKVRRASVAGKKNVAAYRFLEDLIPAGPRSTGRAPPRRSKSRPLGDANGKEESKNKKQGRKVQAPAPASAVASGPFSELSLCVVHLGSVTSNTIKAFCRGVRDGGGGRVSTRYEPGCTTHIVADASLALSLEKLHRYFAGCGDDGDGFDADFGDDHDAAAVVGVDEAAAVGAGARGRTRTRTPDDDGVPFVSSEWVVECLRRSAVVATAPYLLTLPRRAAAAEQAPAEAAGLTRRHEGSGTSAYVAGGGLTAADTTTAAAIAYKRKLDARDDGDDNGSRLSAVASAHPHGRRTQEQQEAELGDGGDAAAESIPRGMSEVQGGFGAREPDVGKRKHKFHCQFTSSRGDHVSRAE